MPQNHQTTKVHKKNYIITLVKLGALVFSWQFLGCDNKSPYQFEPQIVVFSLFIAGYSNPIIKLERSWEIDKKLPEEGLGINDAEVVVSTERDTIKYAPIEDKSGLFGPLDSLTVCPLERYHLKVAVPGEEEIYSETTVPDTFSIIQPEEGDTLDKRGYLPMIIWTRSQNAASYFIDISSRVDTTHFGVNTGNLSTVFPILPFFLGNTGEYVIKVVAIDRNYNEYLKEGDGPPGAGGEEDAPSVFGSCVVESVQVYVK